MPRRPLGAPAPAPTPRFSICGVPKKKIFLAFDARTIPDSEYIQRRRSLVHSPSILRDSRRRLNSCLAAAMELAIREKITFEKPSLLRRNPPPIPFQNQISINQELCTFGSHGAHGGFLDGSVQSPPRFLASWIMPSVTRPYRPYLEKLFRFMSVYYGFGAGGEMAFLENLFRFTFVYYGFGARLRRNDEAQQQQAHVPSHPCTRIVGGWAGGTWKSFSDSTSERRLLGNPDTVPSRFFRCLVCKVPHKWIHYLLLWAWQRPRAFSSYLHQNFICRRALH